MTSSYVIPVPGRFSGCYLDLETVKVPTPDGYRMPNGEALKRRWSVTMAGVARGGFVWIVDGNGRAAAEGNLLARLGELLAGAEVRYAATREFDEMICRGRFTNARRAHLPVPTFPAVPGAETLAWRNLGRLPEYPRGDDVASRDVPAALAEGRWDLVAVHLLRDVAELILAGGNPDDDCRIWCELVLTDCDFALGAVYGWGED